MKYIEIFNVQQQHIQLLILLSYVPSPRLQML